MGGGIMGKVRNGRGVMGGEIMGGVLWDQTN